MKTILDRSVERTEFLEACTPGRGNNEGQARARPRQNANFGGDPLELYDVLKKWRDAGNLPGVEIVLSHQRRDICCTRFKSHDAGHNGIIDSLDAPRGSPHRPCFGVATLTYPL